MKDADDFRTEKDALGLVQVPAGHYWGAQTERARQNFRIGWESMPTELIHAFALQKKAAALANMDLGLLDARLGDAITRACDDVIEGRLDGEFPLPVWQTGSGTQTNMNMNEVIANRANETLGQPLGTKDPVHPNDHVNMSQSSNDSFPTAMHVALLLLGNGLLAPALEHMRLTLEAKADEFKDLVKIGRTHLQDATPLTLGNEFAAYAHQCQQNEQRLDKAYIQLYELAQGGTAVGTGLNAPENFDRVFCEQISALTGLQFKPCPDKFYAIAAHDALVNLSGKLNTIAVTSNKIANDIRLMASGPRAGLGEISLPANEPGSSIMPGKVNPTQAEALTQVAAQVMGNHVTVTVAGTQGHLELNAFKPVMVYSLLQSTRLLGDAIISFTDNCLKGITANEARLRQLTEASLMLVTALTPHIGYDKAAEIALKAHAEGMTLKQAALALGTVAADDFDRWADPKTMLGGNA